MAEGTCASIRHHAHQDRPQINSVHFSADPHHALLGLQGYYLRALKMMNVPKEMAEEHYVDLASKPFYKGLVEYIVRWTLYCALALAARTNYVAGDLHALQLP